MNGAIKWMIRNRVTANLLMVFILVAGSFGAISLRKQVFPEFSPELINISVAYPGASPIEVEEAIVVPTEAALESIDEVEEVNATASQSLAVVTAELRSGVDKQQVLDEVKSAIDRIRTFPVQIERPVVNLASPRSQVIQLVVSGNVGERALKVLAKEARDDLIALGAISDVQISGTRDYELSIEVSSDILDAYGFSLSQLATIVRRESLELSGGEIETRDGRVLLRTQGRNQTAEDFRDIVVLAEADGTEVLLSDIATVTDGFANSDLAATFNGQRAVVVTAYRVGEESVLDVAEAVHTYVANFSARLPKGVTASVWQDQSIVLDGRLKLLIKNGILGLTLVLIALTLFLDLKLAAWTAIGIGISFIGAFALLAPLGVTMNTISLFGFILALGIVVDDAIVMGENIFAEREKGRSPLEAAEVGAIRIARPVVFAVLTTVVAFAPLLFIEGTLGRLLIDLPLVVITVLLLSLVEALFILPMHLSHDDASSRTSNRFLVRISETRAQVDIILQRFISGPLTRGVRFSIFNPECVQQFLEIFCFFCHMLACCGILFNKGRILLSNSVHISNSPINLVYSFSLFL